MGLPKIRKITFPFTASVAEDIDENFDRLFKRVASNESGVLPVPSGGTGVSSFQVGDLLYAETAATIAGLHDITVGNVLLSGGVNVAPFYGKVALSGGITHITGILPVPNGGTGHGLYAVGDIVTADTTTTLARLADIATGNALISGGVGVMPSWGKIGLTTHVAGVLPVPNGGTDIASYAQGDILYASAATTLSKLAKDANATRYLSNTGASNNPAWSQVDLTNGVTGTLPVTSGGTGLASFSQGDIIYASAANTLAALAKNTTATRYLSNTGGSNNPAWAQVDVTNGVTGILPLANGGTGLNASAVTDGQLLIGRSSDNTFQLATLTAGTNITITNGAGSITIDAAGGGGGTSDLLDGGTVHTDTAAYTVLRGSLIVGNSTPKWDGLAIGAANRVLTSNGTDPSWTQVTLSTMVTGVLPEVNGGTNQSTYAQGDILFASAANTLSKLAKNTTTNRYLSNSGTSNNPAWAAVVLNNGVAGTLLPGNGGTGNFTYTIGDLLSASATTTLSKVAAVAAGNVLRSAGTGTLPAWGKVELSGGTTHINGTLPVTNGGTGLATVAQGDVLYASASNTLSALAKNTTATRYLSNTGTSNDPAWAQVDLSNGVTGTLPTANGGFGLSSFAVGDLIYANSTTTITTLAIGAANTVLRSDGTDPDWGQVSNAYISDVAETKITDGALLARVADAETISGAWTFSTNPLITNTVPRLAYTETGAGVNATRWDLGADAGVFALRLLNDDGTFGGNAFTFSRSGSAIANTAVNGAVQMSGSVRIDGALTLNTAIAPVALASGNNNNYAPAGFASAFMLRLTSDAAGSTLTGLAGGANGRMILIVNTSGGTLTISFEDANSTAANRFAGPGGGGISIFANEQRLFFYDGTSSRWRYVI